MKHGETRNHHWEKEGSISDRIHRTVHDQYCASCGQWIEVKGVMGALKFKANHDSGDCSREN